MFDPPPEEEDTPLIKWSAFGAIVILGAFIMGLAFVFGPYYLAAKEDAEYRRHYRHDNVDLVVETDTKWFMKTRFWIGTAVGAVTAAGIWIKVNRKQN